MSLLTFRAIRILRVLPLSKWFDRHLNNCALFVTVYAPTFEEGCARLRWTHLFGLELLPVKLTRAEYLKQILRDERDLYRRIRFF